MKYTKRELFYGTPLLPTTTVLLQLDFFFLNAKSYQTLIFRILNYYGVTSACPENALMTRTRHYDGELTCYLPYTV